MRQYTQMPLLACFIAVIASLFLCVASPAIGAPATSTPSPQSKAIQEIQRLIRQGQLAQALEKTESLISSQPKEAQNRFMKGLILTEMGRQVEAIAIFTRLTEDFPELPEPYNNLAVLYAQQKQYDRARSALEMAIRTHPSYSIAHENLGDVYATLASQAYSKALQIDSSNTAMQTKLSMIRDIISTSSPAKSVTKPTLAQIDSSTVAIPEKTAAVETPKTPASAPSEKPSVPAKTPETKVPETKTVEPKAPDPKTPETKTVSGTTVSSETEVTKTLQSWAHAWSKKEVKTYLGYYATSFQTPNKMTRKAWETERTQRIDKPGKLQISVDNIKVSISGDKATVKFRQHYVSSSLKSSTNKTLVFVKSGNRWLIQQERVG